MVSLDLIRGGEGRCPILIGNYWIIDLVNDPNDPTGPYLFSVVADPIRDDQPIYIIHRYKKVQGTTNKDLMKDLLWKLKHNADLTAGYHDLTKTNHTDDCDYPF